MSSDSRLESILLRWEELQEQGTPAKLEELCAGCPDLLPELERRIAALRSIDARLHAKSRARSRSTERYRIVRPHAKGGLGQVSVAQDTELPREVALKEIQTQRDNSASRTRFVTEAELNGSLEHPGIVPVYSLGQFDDGRPFYVMRFIRGHSLAEAIREFHRGPRAATSQRSGRGAVDQRDIPTATYVEQPTKDVPADEPARESAPAPGDFGSLVFRQLLTRLVGVCNAVEYAHSRGVIHRDIKPANIMLGDFGETLLVDWGLAKRLGKEDVATKEEVSAHAPETRAGMVLGTPAFMSPEQAAGEIEQVGPASDVYSLGATLYNLLTSRPPFLADAGEDVLPRVREGAFAAPRALCRAVPKPLEAICLKAMSKEPGGRYHGARDLARDIERFLADEPVQAWEEPLLQRASRLARKHRNMVRTAVVALGLLFVLAAFSAWRESDLRAKETLARMEAEENFGSAKQSVDRYVKTVVHAELLKEERFKPLLKDLLLDAQTFYEVLIKKAEGRPDRLEELASAVTDAALLEYTYGDMERARVKYERARDLYAELAAGNTRSRSLREGLAKSLGNLGSVQRATSDTNGAHKSFLETIDIYEKLGAEFPEGPYEIELAKVLNNLGVLQRELGSREAAQQSHNRTIAICKKLADQNPEELEYPHVLAMGHLSLANAMLDRRLARASWEEAIAIYKRLLVKNPHSTVLRSELSAAFDNLGRSHFATSELPEATDCYSKSADVLRALVFENPAVDRYKSGLAISLINLGEVQRAHADRQGARASYTEAIRHLGELVRQNGSVSGYRQDLAANLAGLGRLHLDLQEISSARTCFEQACAEFRVLVDKSPRVLEYQSGLIGSLNLLGAAQGMMLDRTQERASFEEAVRRAQQHSDHEGFQGRLAESLVNLGMSQRASGDAAAALASFQQAADAFRTLAKKHAEVAEYLFGEATSLDNLAAIQTALNDRAGAQGSYRRAAEILDALTEKNHGVVQYEALLAHVLTGLGAVPKDAQEGLHCFGRAGDILRGLAEKHPGSVEFEGLLANCLISQAVFLQLAANDLPKAKAAYQQAIGLLKGIVERRENIARHQYLLATGLNNLGIIQKASSELAEARANVASAIDLLESLRASDPRVIEYQENLAAYLSNLGLIQAGLMDMPGAQQSNERAAVVYEELEAKYPRKYEGRLAAAYRAAGRHDEATRIYENVLQRRLAESPADHAALLEAQWNLGVHLQERREFERAEQLLLEVQAQVAKVPPTPIHRLVIPRLVQLYADWGKPNEAAKWQARQTPLPRSD